MKLRFLVILLPIYIIFISGCATSRSEITLPIQKISEPLVKNGKTFYIHSVRDKRIFEKKPKQTNIPSLSNRSQTDNIKIRAVARKRNGYGKALGDILLKEGQTSETLIRDALKQALIEEGYTFISETEKNNDTIILDVDINKFWSWVNIGFWALTLNTEILTNIEVNQSGTTKIKIINTKTSNKVQMGTESNWIAIMQAGLKDFMLEVKKQLK